MVRNFSLKSFFGDLGLWITWIAITALSASILNILFIFYRDICGCSTFHIIGKTSGQGLNTFVLILSIPYGLLAGFFQWTILHKRFERAANWIWVTAVGAVVGAIGVALLPVRGDFGQYGDFYLFPIAVYGLTQTAAQWLFIQKKISNAAVWFLVTLLGWGCLLFAGMFSEIARLEGFEIPGMIFGAMLIGTAAVFLFDRSSQPKINAAILGGLSIVFVLASMISSKVIYGQYLTLSAADCNDSFIHSLVFSPDNRRVAAGFHTQCAPEYYPITVWEVPSGEEIFSIRSEPTTYHVAFSPDGSILASTHGNYAALWDASSGQLLQKIPTIGYPHHLAFSPDGQALAIGNESNDGTITLWNLRENAALHKLRSDAGAITHMAFRPDGTLMVVYKKRIETWDIYEANKIRDQTIHVYLTADRPLAVSPDGKYLIEVGGIWNLVTGEALPEITSGKIYHTAISLDGKIAALEHDDGQVIGLWDLDNEREITSFRIGDQFIQTISFSADRRLLAAGFSDGTVRIFDMPLEP